MSRGSVLLTEYERRIYIKLSLVTCCNNKVKHCGDSCRHTCANAVNYCDLRDNARCVGNAFHNTSVTRKYCRAVINKRACAVEQRNNGSPVLDCHFIKLFDLLCVNFIKRALHSVAVLRERENELSVDSSVAANNTLILFGIAVSANVRTDLNERTRVKKRFDLHCTNCAVLLHKLPPFSLVFRSNACPYLNKHHFYPYYT